MNKIKYAVSGISLALLTAMFMILPNVYNYCKDADNSLAKILSVNIEHTEQELTPEQTVRIIIENLNNCIYRETENEKNEMHYISDCKGIIENVFGNSDRSSITKAIIEILNNCDRKSITTKKFTAIDNDNIVVLNIIEAVFDNMSICYEENSKVMLYLYLYNSDNSNLPFDEDNCQYELEANRPIITYYNALGVNDSEIYTSVDPEPYFYIEAGLDPRAISEYEYSSDEMIQN